MLDPNLLGVDQVAEVAQFPAGKERVIAHRVLQFFIGGHPLAQLRQAGELDVHDRAHQQGNVDDPAGHHQDDYTANGAVGGRIGSKVGDIEGKAAHRQPQHHQALMVPVENHLKGRFTFGVK